MKFRSIDGSTLSPGDRAKYTVAFGVDGSASVVKAWKIVGEELELFDTDGHLVARLEAVRTK